MSFEFIGKCKHCGAETHFVLSPDAPDEFQYAINCVMCGCKADLQDTERFYHLTDTLITVMSRNEISDISKIIVHPQC